MADVVMGVMGNLIPKLAQLAKEEYDLQVGTKERIDSLTKELAGAQAALRKVAEVPWDQLDEQVKLWAREVRESSYDMEDVVDYFLVNFQGRDSVEKESLRKRLAKKMTNLFKKSKARHKVNDDVTSIMTRLDEETKRFHRFKVDDIVAKATTTSVVDPRLAAMYNKVKDLVGINKSSDELISMLQTKQQGDVPSAKMKIVSVVGVGGLGKTTLAKAVYDNLKGDSHCGAFVSVGRNPNLKKVIQRILIDLDKERYMQFNFTLLDEIDQFINELRDYLLEEENKRYFIVIDDIWEVESWETIKFAFDDDNNCGGRIIVTTRKVEVATKAGEVYKLQPLSDDSSRELFHTRMFGGQGHGHVDDQPDEISNKILKKCGGIPLAIITMASLLIGKPREKWPQIYKTIGFERKDCKEVENTMRILSFSYYDLPSHLRTCLLYLSAFPEDFVIPKASLIWKWVAEGFVHEKEGMRLFEIGEGYFNDLINKSLIQEVAQEDDDILYGIGCRVHDIVLDFIRSMSREENFLTVLDNDHGTVLLQNHARRLAHHNRTIIQHSHHANHVDGMRIVRTLSAQGCAVESWAPLSTFTLLRVLAIEGCELTDGCRIRMENMGHLLHLRYLSLAETSIDRVSEEIGALRFLQTLDLFGSEIIETPTSSSLPTQLACLRITFDDGQHTGAEVAWVERLTSLEELLIDSRYQWKELRSLRELRVLTAGLSVGDEESERGFVESVSHLDKLQQLILWGDGGETTWKVEGLVLSRELRHLAVYVVLLQKLPPCINPSSLPYLSLLDLRLLSIDEQDLRNLGGLPELRILRLGLEACSTTIRIINDNDNVVYFPKLRCFEVTGAMLLFVASEEDRNIVSFHLWDGEDNHIAVPFATDSSIIPGKGGAAATAPRFMLSLQELSFRVYGEAARDHRYCDNFLGWEYLSSLQAINVWIWFNNDDETQAKIKAALRRTAHDHPNRPVLNINP